MYQCFHCLHNTLCWECDYSFEDFGYEGEGIVQILHCSNCGAEVEYRISLDEEDIKEVKEIDNNGNKNDEIRRFETL